MPHAQCPMPNAQCPMPNSQYLIYSYVSTPLRRLYLASTSAAVQIS
ncbi:hypothetical protein [[Scytonema hofmanni] UTEX B 1581]|nr:hypothetical protein [[Scytonema hofmanni] UTEX B 1581]